MELRNLTATRLAGIVQEPDICVIGTDRDGQYYVWLYADTPAIRRQLKRSIADMVVRKDLNLQAGDGLALFDKLKREVMR